MARSVSEVLVGVGTLYVAPAAEAAPTNPSTAVGGNWEDVGYSEEGWSMEVDKTFEDVLVAEEIDPIAIYKTAQVIRVTGIMAQASLDNVNLAMGGGTITPDDPAVGFDSYAPPGSDEFEEKAVLLRVPAPGTVAQGFLRDIYFPRVVAAGAFSLAHTKAPQKAVIAVEFRAVVPETGTIFSIIDQTA